MSLRQTGFRLECRSSVGDRAEAEARVYPQCVSESWGDLGCHYIGRHMVCVESQAKVLFERARGTSWWYSGWNSACQSSGYAFNPWSRKIPLAEHLKALTLQLLSLCATTNEAHLPWSLCSTTEAATVSSSGTMRGRVASPTTSRESL